LAWRAPAQLAPAPALAAASLVAVLVLALVAALAAALAATGSAFAQEGVDRGVTHESSLAGDTHGVATPGDALEVSWIETRGPGVVVLYRAGDEAVRDTALGVVGPAYSALVGAFGAELAEPLTLRIHPTRASFMRSNPLVVETDGLLAGTRRGRREIEVVAPQADGPQAGSLDNALRREIARLLVTEVSDDRLPDALLDGASRFMERPGEANAGEVARLRDSFSRDGLYRWSEIAAPGSAYLDPRVAQPESKSIVHYLVDTYGFPAFLSFLTASSEAATWRIALESAYGVAPDRLESAWLQWLPAYLDGGWRRHPLYATDLGAVETLIAAGDFQGAQDRLAVAGPLLASEDPDAGTRARFLLEQANAGEDAVEQLAAAVADLEAGDYGAGASNASSAERALAALGQDEAAAAAAEVARRAQIGLSASADFRRASQLPEWRATEARLLAAAAATGFSRLGNEAAADRATALVGRIDRRLVPAAWVLLTMGALLLAWNLRRRLSGDDREARVA
jgi:hypothetical protein